MNRPTDVKVKDVDWRRIPAHRLGSALRKLGLFGEPDMAVPGAVWRTACDQCEQPLYYATMGQEPSDNESVFCIGCLADFWQAVRDRQQLQHDGDGDDD